MKLSELKIGETVVSNIGENIISGKGETFYFGESFFRKGQEIAIRNSNGGEEIFIIADVCLEYLIIQSKAHKPILNFIDSFEANESVKIKKS